MFDDLTVMEKDLKEISWLALQREKREWAEGGFRNVIYSFREMLQMTENVLFSQV